jgi:hypothetical protein
MNPARVSCGGSSSPNADARALDQGNRGPPHPREVKPGLRDSAGALEHDCMVSPAILRTSLSSCFAYAAVEVMLKVRPWR